MTNVIDFKKHQERRTVDRRVSESRRIYDEICQNPWPTINHQASEIIKLINVVRALKAVIYSPVDCGNGIFSFLSREKELAIKMKQIIEILKKVE